MKKRILLSILLLLGGAGLCHAQANTGIKLFPADRARNVNPDTHLSITFPGTPKLGSSGIIRIFDADTHMQVDSLDLSIPVSPFERNPAAPYSSKPYDYTRDRQLTNVDTKPGTPSGEAAPTSDKYQLTIIGGFTDGFHFYPVIIRGNTATIYPHNNLLQYGKNYYVTIDPEVLTTDDGSFRGIKDKNGWTFSTKSKAPSRDSKRLVVSADGTGDFNTVQGAMDFIPDNSKERITVFIKNGDYEEIVYFRNKTNVTLLGESRNGVNIHYANNEVFNSHPVNLSTNEVPGTFPSRRAAFTADNVKGLQIVNMTIQTTIKGQAEGLLLMGERNIVSHVNVRGSGDALQVNGPTYFTNIRLDGDGDMILGRGPSFFINCELRCSAGPFMWIRNTNENHGNVFVNCLFQNAGNREAYIARLPKNGQKNYPYSEAVLLNCVLDGLTPEGWGRIDGDPSQLRYWEYNSTNLKDGKPVDISRRHPASRQLTMEKDAQIIADYSNPAYVLGGWTPAMAPIILTQPLAVNATEGASVTLRVEVAAVPSASYQWYRDGKPIVNATGAVLTLEKTGKKDAGRYTVSVKNDAGTATSEAAVVSVK